MVQFNPIVRVLVPSMSLLSGELAKVLRTQTHTRTHTYDTTYVIITGPLYAIIRHTRAHKHTHTHTDTHTHADTRTHSFDPIVLKMNGALH